MSYCILYTDKFCLEFKSNGSKVLCVSLKHAEKDTYFPTIPLREARLKRAQINMPLVSEIDIFAEKKR